jgi:hypothetical protein
MKHTLVFLSLILGVMACQQPVIYQDPLDKKVKGLVFTGPGRGPLPQTAFSAMAQVKSNFVAVVPEATVYRQNLKVVYDFQGQWYGETKRATLEGIQLARDNGLQVMMKPHLTIGWDTSDWDRPEVDFSDSLSRVQFIQSQREFVSKQEDRIEGTDFWRGALMTKNDADWAIFAEEYARYILDYAQIADSLGVELFCIGTEMKRTALEKPEYWSNLIKRVKEVYKGPLVYAANWDSYDKIDFWDELDYIGVDAYFPLSKLQKPKYEELLQSWETYGQKLQKLSEKHKKPIILTEWGYQNEDYVGTEPWANGRYNGVGGVNNQAQADAYKSMFESIWEKPWMKGVFVWRWSSYSQARNLPDYSPRSKPAEQILKQWFQGEN